MRYKKRKQGGKNKKEEAESRTQWGQNNGGDKKRQRQLKGDEMEERWRGGKENAKTNVRKWDW